MGIFSKGILGGFSGKVGTVIGSTWRGISYMRSLPGPRKGTPTEVQMAQRVKFSLVTRFLRPMSSLLNVTYQDFAKKMSGVNSAFSYCIKNAITGVYPAFVLDFSLALVARGSLPNVNAPAITSTTPGIINFTWTDNSGIGIAKATDKAILVAYSDEMGLSEFVIGAAVRNAAAASLSATVFSGKQVHTWLAFISENGKDVANSIYTGPITVA